MLVAVQIVLKSYNQAEAALLSHVQHEQGAMPDLLERLKSALGDRYGIEKEIGRGGMAVVFLAEDLKHHRQVALKVLHPELTATLGAERFLHEIEIIAGLQHPHILPLYDSGDAEGLLYYVMPYAEGESLRQRLDREGQLAVDESVRITVEVADGLDYAHRKGVVHRDIKPGNILLAEGHATIADFGIARAVEAARQERITRTGLGVGTPLYSSPEQATSEETLDGRTDIYSLGCVLYEMLAGEPPLTGATPQMIQARRLSETPTPLHALRDTVPPALDHVIARALARIPADRYATASQFGQALQAVLFASTPGAMGDLSATPPSVTTTPAGNATKRTRRLRFWLPVVAVAGALAVAGTWVLYQRQARQGPDAPPDSMVSQEPPLDRSRVAVLAFDYTDEAESFLASSLTESVSQELRAVDGFRIIPTDSVRQLEILGLSHDSLQRVLDAGLLVVGRVHDRRQLTVSLIGAEEGAEKNTRQFKAADAVALRDSATRTLRAWLARASGMSEELLQQAAEATERATALMDEGDADAANDLLSMADSLLKAVEEIEPDWVEPTVQRGWLAYKRSRWAGGEGERWIDEGMNHATVALQLQPEHPDALELRGTLRYWKWLLNLEPDPETAEQLFADAEADLRQAISVNPDQAGAWAILSHHLLYQGDTAAGRDAVRKALTADPTVRLLNEEALLWRAFSTSYDLGELDESEYWCGILALRSPEAERTFECRLWQMTLPGAPTDVDRAWALADALVQLRPSQEVEFSRRWAGMAVAAVLAQEDLPDSARAVADRSRGDVSIDPTRDLVYVEAFVRTLLGDNEEAIDLLAEFMAASGAGPSDIDFWWFDGLREEPRYQALLSTGASQ